MTIDSKKNKEDSLTPFYSFFLLKKVLSKIKLKSNFICKLNFKKLF